MKNLKFIKEIDNKWYIDLPDWQGDKEDLEMVAGTDILLDTMAQGDNEIYASVSEEYMEHKYKLLALYEPEYTGMLYNLYDSKDKFMMIVWICDVAKYLYNGKFPQRLFVL